MMQLAGGEVGGSEDQWASKPGAASRQPGMRTCVLERLELPDGSAQAGQK